jgi:hypothetical protein
LGIKLEGHKKKLNFYIKNYKKKEIHKIHKLSLKEFKEKVLYEDHETLTHLFVERYSNKYKKDMEITQT